MVIRAYLCMSIKQAHRYEQLYVHMHNCTKSQRSKNIIQLWLCSLLLNEQQLVHASENKQNH